MLSDMTYSWLFNGVQTIVALEDGQQVVPINFDNAATTPPLKHVDDFIFQNVMMYGSVGRGGHKSSYCTHAYELSRKEVLSFFGAEQCDDYEVIYVKNTTEGLNLLSRMLCDTRGDKILATRMEHHANDLPWRQVASTYFAEITEDGRLDLEDLEKKLSRANGSIAYVTVCGASNVTGYINPIHEIARIVHKHGAKLIVDGAQLVAHRKINLLGKGAAEAIDALVFSGHKMYAPFGEGVVIVRRELVEGKVPFISGGGAVTYVLDDDVYYKPSPYKEEAGTPNFLGAMAIVAAMDVLNEVTFEKIESHEMALLKRLIDGLKQIPCVEIYGDKNEHDRVGVISFNLNNHEHGEVGRLLQEKRGIAVRTGCFCAQPYVTRLLGISNEERYRYMNNPSLKQPGMVRASFGLYNTSEEVDEFLNVLEAIARQS